MNAAHPGAADPSPPSLIARARQDARLRCALDIARRAASEIEATQLRLCRVPAPPFGEAARARRLLAELAAAGFAAEETAIGNVVAAFDGFGVNPVVVAAHLDTVFPADTRLEPRREGAVVRLPGIADNGAGLAALVWAFRAAREAGVRFQRPVVLAGTVGEEGLGDLRGVRHLFEATPWPGPECDFIALEGAGVQRIANQALGSRRFRAEFRGPGGHSWADFGAPQPVEAMAAVIAGLAESLRHPGPGATYNVGVVRGGTSVNAIPAQASFEVDFRAVVEARLDSMEQRLRAVVLAGAARHRVESRLEEIGRRPSGRTDAHHRLVRLAVAATRQVGVEPILDLGSTDANIPMALGLPAVSLGAGGACGGIHTLEEWYDPTDRQRGLERLLLTVAAVAGLE